MKKGLLLWLFVAMSVLHTFAQTRTITGKVTDTKDGSPLPGVSVIVKGTTKGTVTGADGSYAIEAAAKDALLFSFIGYVNQEKAVGGATNISVALGTDNKQLNEVVVTALGVSKEKKSLGYSVQKIGSDELINSNEHNVIQALASKAAGVQVIGSGGTPGASTKIIIRGNSTFNLDNQPLIVIDGVPMDNSTNSTAARNYPYNSNLQGVNNSNRALDINPDDIASVTVLKGPAAAALYGANAASGAIIYTTKRGRSGATRVTYSFNAGFDKVSKLPEEQKIYSQGPVGATPVYDPGGTGTSSPYSWGPAVSSVSGAKIYNNTDEFFKTATNFTHDLSVIGGNENTSFRLSLNRVDQNGIVPTTDLQRTTFRINADSKISERLTMGVSASYVLTEGTKAQNGSNTTGVMLPLMRAPISWNLADYKNADGSSKNYYNAYDNPYWSLYNNPYKDKTDRFYGNVNTTFKILDWLSLTNRTGVDMYTQFSKQIFAIGSNAVSDYLGQIEENTFTSRDLYSDLILSGHKTFADKLDVTANLGGNIFQQQGQNDYAKGTQLSIPNYYNLNNASTLYADNSTTIKRTSALYYDLEFGYRNQFFLTTTGRNEWSSTFGQSKNNFFYPSVSGSWVFSEIVPANNVITYGKVRAAIAAGGKSPSVYSTNTVYTTPSFADGFTDGNSFPFKGQNGMSLSNTLGNKGLKPERSVEKELGLDFKLFSRVNVELTYYNKTSSDILVYRPIAGSSGFQYILDNAGKMQNKGIEVLASADVLKLKDFTWNVQVNFARNKNTVLALAEGVTENSVESAFASIGSYAIVGQPYGALYGSKWARNDAGQVVINATTGLPTIAAASGNLGNPFPDWTGGARTTFTYKNFTLSALLDVRHGGKIWNGTYARMNNLGRTKESADRERTYVVPGVVLGADGKYTENTKTVTAQQYYRIYKGDAAGSAVENSVENGSWVRLRELNLGYKYSFAKSSPVKSVELSLTGRNLWLHTKYKGVDPETSLTGAGSNLTGFDYFNNPGTKTYAVGVRVGF
ncbi:SusC/RagA family TonB-linked outer membrane protein [Chitinophaga sancti]|uniref:SusC/RagA family TonB-linked outer membrane protein n=1 Tax=Chitinophaga sancti TaxID=1004 RepID=UPI003F7B1219